MVAAVLLLAVPATSQPEGPDPRPALFRAEPMLHGVVKECGGTSPLKNGCVEYFSFEDCDPVGCGPRGAPGVGFTGTLTAIVWGKSQPREDGRPQQDRWLAESCSYAAGSQTQAFLVRTGACTYSQLADPCPSGEPNCYVMWPPFRIEGRAQPNLGVGPSGAWTAQVVT